MHATVILNSDNQVNQQTAEASVTEEPQISKASPSVADGENMAVVHAESSASEFSFPKSEKLLEDRSQQYLPTVSMNEHASEPKTPPPYAGKSIPISSSLELAVVPQESSNSLGSVLEALQRAKLSLSQKLNSSPQVAEGRSLSALEPSNTDSFLIPFGTPGLFRLPTDYQYESTTRVDAGIGANPSFGNFPHGFGADRRTDYQYEATTPGIGASPSLGIFPHAFGADRLLTEPLVEPRSGLSGDLFRTVPSRSLTTPEMRPVVPPPERFLSQPRLGGGSLPSTSTSHLDPYPSSVRPPFQDPYKSSARQPFQDSYPFLPDITLRVPPNEASSPSSEKGLPPFMRLSSYDGQAGPSMYR